MTQRELDRGGLLGNTVAVAHGLDPCCALHDLFGRGLVVVVRPGPRVGQDAAVEHTSRDDRDPAFHAKRQQILQAHLVQQRVAAGEQEAIELRLAGETRQHLRLVHAGPDRLDRAVGPKPVERSVGTGECFLEVLIRVVDVEDVDLVDAQPRDALLDRAHDAVVREVIHGVERGRARKRVALRRRARTEQAADLGREHVLVSRLGAEHCAEALLRQAIPVLGRGVEKANASRPRGLDDLMRLIVRESLEQAPQRRGAETQPRDLERRAAELDPLCRIQAEAPVSTCLRSHRSPLAMWAVAAALASSGSRCMIAS